MKIRIRLSILCVIGIISCKQNINNIRDEKNYILFKTDSFHHVIASKILINKYDDSMHLILLFSGDGKLLSKSFFKNKLRDGIYQTFYYNGNLMNLEFYKKGIKDGIQKEYYPNGKLKETENYTNGKLISLDKFDSSGNKINQ